MRKLFAAIALAQLATLATAQTTPKRTIDRCAQDGAWFSASDTTPGAPLSVQRDGISLRIEHPSSNSSDAVVTLSHGSHVLVQKQKGFDQSFGWLTVSQNHAFALTWNFSASAASTSSSASPATSSTHRRSSPCSSKRHCRRPGIPAPIQVSITDRRSSGSTPTTSCSRSTPGPPDFANPISLRASSSTFPRTPSSENSPNANSSICQPFAPGM